MKVELFTSKKWRSSDGPVQVIFRTAHENNNAARKVLNDMIRGKKEELK